MKDSRIGQSLWQEWFGSGYESEKPNSLVFYTVDHISLDEDIVLRALASCLQRDGIADSLADGFKMATTSLVTIGYAGTTESDDELTLCDSDGFTSYGDSVEDIQKITWVEL